MSKKTHYRKVYKSDHLGTADLEDFIEQNRSLIFTIKHVKQELNTTVAGRKISANIAYFKENIKPMVLNATNAKIVKNLSGGSSFVEDWNNILIELYIDPSVKMKGEVVGGLRIRDKAPVPINKTQLEALQKTINEIEDLQELTKLYNSDIKYKTSLEAVNMFKERNRELTSEQVD